jgi:hypothetical protein
MPFWSNWVVLFVLQITTKYRSFLFGSYINLLNYIEQNSSSKLRVLLFFIICVFTMYVKITRILLYYFKVNALRNRINPTHNELNQKRVVLQNEPQYRYVLNLIIIVCYIVNVILLESITDRWPVVVACVTYFIIHSCSVSLAQSYADQIDDISCCKFLRFLRVIFIGLIIGIVIMLVVFAFFYLFLFLRLFSFLKGSLL